VVGVVGRDLVGGGFAVRLPGTGAATNSAPSRLPAIANSRQTASDEFAKILWAKVRRARNRGTPWRQTEPGVPVLDVRHDHVAAGAVAGRVDVIDEIDEIEIHEAVVAVAYERDSVVIAVDVQACGLVEPDGFVHVHHGERGCQVDHAAGLCEPADASPADADVLVALQCCGFGFVLLLSAARAGQQLRAGQSPGLAVTVTSVGGASLVSMSFLRIA
jgi:hypothetical protein